MSDTSTEDNLHAFCTPDKCVGGYHNTDASDIAWSLARVAYSCLASTPSGVPKEILVGLASFAGGGTGIEDSECCDLLGVSVGRIKPVNMEHGVSGDAYYVSHKEGCNHVGRAIELDVVLLRPCVPSSVINNGRNPRTTKEISAQSLLLIDDAANLDCCIRQCLAEEVLVEGACGDGGDFIVKAAVISHDGSCGRVVIPVVIELNTCCGGMEYIPDCAVEE